MNKRQVIVSVVTGVVWFITVCGLGILTKPWFDEGGQGQVIASFVVPLVFLASIIPSFILAVSMFGGSSVKEVKE